MAADDFAELRASLADGRGLVSLGNYIERIRIIFHWAYEAGLLASPMRFGPDFRPPSNSILRREKPNQGLNHITTHGGRSGDARLPSRRPPPRAELLPAQPVGALSKRQAERAEPGRGELEPAGGPPLLSSRRRGMLVRMANHRRQYSTRYVRQPESQLNHPGLLDPYFSRARVGVAPLTVGATPPRVASVIRHPHGNSEKPQWASQELRSERF